MSDKQLEVTALAARILKLDVANGILAKEYPKTVNALSELLEQLQSLYLDRGYGLEAYQAIEPIDLGVNPDPMALAHRGAGRVATRLSYLQQNLVDGTEKEIRSLLEDAIGITTWVIQLLKGRM